MKLPAWLLVLSVLAVSAPSGMCQEARQTVKALPRFYEVAPGVYRGGQPTREGFILLKERGIRTVINLREGRNERGLVEGLGMKYVYIPVDPWRRVPASAIQTFLATVSDPANHPVFVHCRRGADRTGFMIGAYRIAHQGWSAKQAYAEARALGMRWWFRGLKRQLREFAEQNAALRPSPAGR